MSGYAGLRARVSAEVRAAVHGGDLQLERYDRPLGDPGLLGIRPGDPAWRVHSSATGMLTGGFAALMLQSLHPLAMAGVAQFSDFRTDPLGRLSRTARFVSTTTFGSAPAARESIALVRRIHARVHGTAPDGRPYRADDPELLTWVHTAEVYSFLRGHQVFAAGRSRLGAAECDAYFAQVAPIAEALGACGVPHSAGEAVRYLSAMRPRLRATPAALESVRFLRGFGRNPRERLVVRGLMNGSVGLLPGWARAELGIRRPAAVRALADRPYGLAVGRLLEWGIGPSEIQAAARRRISAAARGRTEGGR
ncbi:oxygenase MpaB family protein [Phaeacidiphilus oryzae]|uniref:oxygenase MpaB family protein n=1 Tax=Phaeacidiphilus oryzae TaxID=348818 RepID=UPI0005640BCA|nr:oxygenase MpaB family protein [Phaeacidiphilus oryzae]